MRKKWGMILGLTGMMLLGAQSIYAAEAADGTAETTDAASEKETAGTDDIESRIKKGGFTAVKNRREGKSIFYSLADDHVRTIINQGREHIEEN